MNQISGLGFGMDNTVLAGAAHTAGDRLGSFDLIIENTGSNDLTLLFKTYSESSWTQIGSSVTVKAGGGTTTEHFSLINKTLGFFGSGNTTANITVVIRNKGDLRGAQIDLKTPGHKGWGYDLGFDKNANRTPWTSDWGTNGSNAGPTTSI